MKPIALDAMGGDFMPQAAIEGAVAAHKNGIPVILVGDEPVLVPLLEAQGVELPIHHAKDVITMNDHASNVRRRKESSIIQAMQLAKEGTASACVSMGHSGATMAAALFVLGRIKGLERPAIFTTIPYQGGVTGLIDAGANADCRASFLQQFAVMGTIYAQAQHHKPDPSVGLMSIGEEPEKGNELTLGAHKLLKATPGINFFGNIEGRDLMKGTVDVVVTDGFTGNVMLKLAEGEARALFGWIRHNIQKGNVLTKLGAFMVKPALTSIAKRLDPSEHGAQPLLGVNGYVFIGHGSANARAVYSALKVAQEVVEGEILGKLMEGLKRLR